MDAIDALRTRRSIRVYLPQTVEPTLLEQIIDCGRLAATARNEQPWEFVVITNAPLRKALADITSFGKFIADAPVCIVVLCRDGKYYLEDGCAATQNILVAARALGLATCWVAGDKKEYAGEIRTMLGAPPEYKLVSLISLGYSDRTPTPPKRPLEDVLHWEQF